MNRTKLSGVLVAAVAIVSLAGCSRSGPKNVMASDQADRLIPQPNVVLACPGRIEGRTETVQVGAGADGVVRQVLVREGQAVRRGARLAEIDCHDLESSLQSARAELDAAEQVKVRLLRGSREEERQSAEQRTIAAKAVLDEARTRLDRMKQLKANGVVAAVDFDQAQRDYDVAEAKLKEARRNEELVKASALQEDVDKADAEIRAAGYRVHTMEDKIGKCTVTAPMDGTILRVLMKPGEAYSTMAPMPIFTMSDLSVRRVRAEVDERDVMKVRAGQTVLVSTEADQNDRYHGVVESVSKTMGRKHIQTGDPSDKSDRDVMETLVRLDKGVDLPVGMRVVVKFEGLKN